VPIAGVAVEASPYRYPLAVRSLHWISAALILVAYLTADSAEDEGVGGAINWHVLAGLALLLLFVPRLLARLFVRQHAPIARNATERLVALTMHIALLLFVVVQPITGILIVWSEGAPLAIPLTSWQLPPLLQLGNGWEERLEDLHETVGNVFYGVIGLHVAAAFWHHYVRRDRVLRQML
jgi:cytochrome b561